MRLKLLFYVCLFTCTLQAGNDISNKLEALCSSLVDSLPSSVKSARVAVIPFEDKTGNDSYGLSTSEYLVVILKKKNIFSLINDPVDLMPFMRKKWSNLDKNGTFLLKNLLNQQSHL